MADIMETFSNVFPWMKTIVFFIKISLNFVPKGPINNKSSLVPVITLHWTGDKPLSEQMMINEAIWRH